MPCPHNHFFYDGTGKVDGDKLRDYLGGQFNKVVAWFKFQRTASNMKLTIRDKVIHKQLTELFGIAPQLFTCSLIGCEASESCATHTFIQGFLRYHNLTYEKIPVHVPNLSETNYNYKHSEPATQSFNKLMTGLNIDRKNAQGLLIIHKIHDCLQNQTDTVLDVLSESEKRMYDLENECKQIKTSNIKKLKKKIKYNKKKEMLKNANITAGHEAVTKKSETSKQRSEEESEPMEVSSPDIFLSQESTKRKDSEIENSFSSKESSPDLQRKIVNSPRRRGRGRGKAKEVKDIR